MYVAKAHALYVLKNYMNTEGLFRMLLYTLKKENSKIYFVSRMNNM